MDEEEKVVWEYDRLNTILEGEMLRVQSRLEAYGLPPESLIRYKLRFLSPYHDEDEAPPVETPKIEGGTTTPAKNFTIGDAMKILGFTEKPTLDDIDMVRKILYHC